MRWSRLHRPASTPRAACTAKHAKLSYRGGTKRVRTWRGGREPQFISTDLLEKAIGTAEEEEQQEQGQQLQLEQQQTRHAPSSSGEEEEEEGGQR